MSNDRIIILLAGLIPGIILMIIGAFIIRADKNRLINCTEKTLGTVIRYSVSDWHTPVVEFLVDNNRYTNKLTYSSVTEVSSPLHKSNYQEIDLSATSLKLKNTNLFYLMKKTFPIGSKLEVYYNPDNPKNSYVLRYTKNYMGKIMLWTGIGVIVLVTILSLVLPIN